MDVLIAHGSGPARAALTGALQGWDGELPEVGDGVAALEMLMSDDGPRIALVDWDLPRLDGCELCRILRDFALGRRSYLILLASRASGGCVDAGLEAGAHDFVVLPVTQEDLRARVDYARQVVELPWGQVSTLGESAPAADGRGLPDVDDRRAILRRLDEEVARAQRDGSALSIALLHFEGMDDLRRFSGKETCTTVLREASRRLRASLRPYDGLGWVAGDEFLVTMPRTSASDIETVLARLRGVLADQPVADGGLRYQISAAIGGATGREDSAAELLASARASLGAALAEGPGRVVPGRQIDLEAVLA